MSPNTTPIAVSARSRGLPLWRSSPPWDGSPRDRADVTLGVEASTAYPPGQRPKSFNDRPRIASSSAAAGGRWFESHDQLSAPPALRLALSARNLCGDRLFSLLVVIATSLS